MALPGLLVEYLVSGALALPWLTKLLGWHPVDVPNWQIPLLGVLLYVAGMAVDVAAFAVTFSFKWRFRRWTAGRLGIAHDSKRGAAAQRQVRLMKYSSEVAKELSARSGRDRIARGAMLNAAIATVVLRDVVPWWQTGSLCVLAAVMWLYFEYTSHVFELRAIQAMEGDNGARPRAT